MKLLLTMECGRPRPQQLTPARWISQFYTNLVCANRCARGRAHSEQSAFTMVEIAMCLAIIGFALVAIIGVLPFGLNVQKENREETVITQEANYFMDAIRNGARGLDELTNNVISISNYWTVWNTNVPYGDPWVLAGPTGTDGYTRTSSRVTSAAVADDAFPLTNGLNIIGLLGRPKFENVGPPLIRSNHVIALVRAISGSATEKYPQTNALVQDLAFSYRMVSEVHDLPHSQIQTNSQYDVTLRGSLREVRLRFLWPLLPQGKLGNGRQTFRSLAGGQLQRTNYNNQPVFFFNPTLYYNPL